MRCPLGPVAHWIAHRAIVDDRGWGHPAIDCSRVNVSFERRARLTVRLPSAIELVLQRKMRAADHRHDLAGRWADRNKRSLIRTNPLRLSRCNSPVHGALSDIFHLRIDRRVDLQAAFVRRSSAERLFELVHNVSGKPRIAVALQAFGPKPAQLQRRGVRVVSLRLRDVAAFDHPVQHVPLAHARERKIYVRRIDRRRGDQPGKHRGLTERQRIGAATEIGMRGSVDAVRARSEIDQVEIAFEYLVLGVVPLDFHGKQRFLNLARDRLLIGVKKRARQLLRDRRGALLDPVVRQVRDAGAHDAEEIDAMVRVEIMILVGDERVTHHRRNLIDR